MRGQTAGVTEGEEEVVEGKEGEKSEGQGQRQKKKKRVADFVFIFLFLSFGLYLSVLLSAPVSLSETLFLCICV